MGLQIDGLVIPLSEEAPSGPDMYGDPDRQMIESAFEGSISEGSGINAESGEWRETIGLIKKQLEVTRDLWLPVYLMRAAALDGDFSLVADSAELLARLLEERWEDVHPQLDEVGFIGRKTPCESLTRIAEFLGPIRQVPLLKHERLGRFSGSDLIRFAENGSGTENYGMFRALLDASEPEDLKAVAESLLAMRGAISRADSVLTANAEGDTSTNFAPTYEVIDQMHRALKSFLPPDPSDDDGLGEAGGSSGFLRQSSGSGPAFTGSITSRDDVRRAIDSICEYYRQFEPGSPVPIVLRRARDWISLDFMKVLEDIAPGGLDEARRVLKSAQGSTDDSSDWGGGSSSGSDDSSWGSDSSSSESSDGGW